MIWPRLLPRLDLALLLAMATAWAISHRQGLDVAAIEAAVGDMGAWAPLAYISLFALAAVLFVPGSILSLAGGGLFGPVWGTAYALLGATVGATLAFLAARYLASDWVVATAGGRLKQLAEGVEAKGWRFIAFVRLVALFPFNLVNYALGLTRVRLLDYSLASLVSMAPGAIAYTYLGCAGREAVAGGEALVQKGLMALGLVALLAFFPRVVRRLRSYSFTWLDAAQLPERIGNGAALMIIDLRGPDEFNGELGHLGGGRKHPDRRASRRIGDFDQFKKQEVVLGCRTKTRSARAAVTLKQARFRNVAVLRGGMAEWSRQRLPAEKETGFALQRVS